MENIKKADSTMKANELALSMFGSPDDIDKMAKTDKDARSYDEVRHILMEIVDKPLVSRAGITATISKSSINKILSGKAVSKSFDIHAHLLAAANLEKLFLNAIEPFSFDIEAGKNNEHLVAIHRLYALMVFHAAIIPVKFTVKEMDNPKDGRRIYSLEAINIDLREK
jgi:hypothetical protein